MNLSLGCCCNCTPIPIGIHRYCEVVGPTPGTHSEAGAWEYSLISPYPYTSGGVTRWQIKWNPTDPVDPVDDAYRKACKPLRFRITNFDNNYGVPNAQPILPTPSDPVPQLFETGGFPLVDDYGFAGHSNVLPVTASHVSTRTLLTDVLLTLSGFEALPAVIPGATWTDLKVHVVAARVLIDGVDATGKVSIGPVLLNSSILAGLRVTGVVSDLIALPDGDHRGKTVEFDLWIETAIWFNTPPASAFEIVNANPACRYARTSFQYGNAAEKRTCGKNWKLTFSEAFDGLSEIVLGEQSGWTYTRYGGRLTLFKNPTSAVAIWLYWNSEYACLALANNALNNSPSGTGAMMRYFPADSGHYKLSTLANGFQPLPGIWNPSAATVFSLRQREHSHTFGNWATENGGYRIGTTQYTWPSNYFSNFPTTVTVEPV